MTADAVADRMSKELNDVVGVGIDPPFGGLVPFGKRSAFPHAVPSKDRLKTGDALILSFGAQVGGYNVECERSFCVGKPTDYAKRLFDAMLAAHDAGVENMKEGAVAEEVDQKSLDQIRKAGFEKFLKHRTGHGIGLEGHEAPWIAEGDKTVLQQGMTFSCEPGVYDPDFGRLSAFGYGRRAERQGRGAEQLSHAPGRYGHRDLSDAPSGQFTDNETINDSENGMAEKIEKPETEWQKQLSPEQYYVTRKAGTEPAFSGKYWKTKDAGTYACVCCGQPLFTSDTKFDSGTGWPSFLKPVDEAAVVNHTDKTYGMVRTETRCARCNAHLGHVFEDGPAPDWPALLHEFGGAGFEAGREEVSRRKLVWSGPLSCPAPQRSKVD